MKKGKIDFCAMKWYSNRVFRRGAREKRTGKEQGGTEKCWNSSLTRSC